MTAQFFDALPAEATGNIVRFFSRRQIANSWKSHVSIEDAIPLCRGEGTVRDVSSRLFSAISTCPYPPYLMDKGRNTLHFSTEIQMLNSWSLFFDPPAGIS